ncbi:magnesium transporter [Actibacterium mucosum KCTC 23349]|uniref:Magnesium transporter MgtE n=1 Tax=Actibacterium mucosum KCTC 23349 TaxID=1454373 RepID=A0A037ZLS4_9RHOB|nr:magnesium transporter [Actibacterium mucosum]KAJ56477.1 magnesium transporter [Actibacterium mucosum KCTC 23349]
MLDEPLQEAEAEDGYALEKDLFSSVRLAVAAGDKVRMDALFSGLHPADIADLLEQVDGGHRREILLLAGHLVDGDVLSELNEDVRRQVIGFLPDAAVAEAVRDLESDDVVDLVEDLEVPEQQAILNALDVADRVAVEQALAYPETSAGRLMQRELVAAPEHWNVGDAIDFLRSNKKKLPDQFYHIIVVDPAMRPVGYVTLGRLLASKRAVPLTEIFEESFRVIPAAQDEAEVAYAFNQYHLISAPVVDAQERLVGVITIDDAMNVLDEEHEEDILRLAGISESNPSDGIVATTKRRFPWLFVNLITAILASMVISTFEATIAQLVALAVLMPIVASMGGNAGTQSLTVAVRALATKDLTVSNIWRVVRREVLVGLVNGVIFAVVMGAIALIWFGSPMLGVVIGVAMVVNLVIAGLAGIVIPVALEKAGADPALASGAFVTTVTDVVGFFAFLGLAAVILL